MFFLNNNRVTIEYAVLLELRSEEFIIPESITQYFGFTGVLGKQAHSRLRNYFYNTEDGQKDKQDGWVIYCELPNTVIPECY